MSRNASKKPSTPKVLAERAAKRNKTRQDNKYKLDNFDRLREENERLTKKMKIFMNITADFVGEETWESVLSRRIHQRCVDEGVEEDASEVEEIDDDEEEDQNVIAIVD